MMSANVQFLKLPSEMQCRILMCLEPDDRINAYRAILNLKEGTPELVVLYYIAETLDSSPCTRAMLDLDEFRARVLNKISPQQWSFSLSGATVVATWIQPPAINVTLARSNLDMIARSDLRKWAPVVDGATYGDLLATSNIDYDLTYPFFREFDALERSYRFEYYAFRSHVEPTLVHGDTFFSNNPGHLLSSRYFIPRIRCTRAGNDCYEQIHDEIGTLNKRWYIVFGRQVRSFDPSDHLDSVEVMRVVVIYILGSSVSEKLHIRFEDDLAHPELMRVMRKLDDPSFNLNDPALIAAICSRMYDYCILACEDVLKIYTILVGKSCFLPREFDSLKGATLRPGGRTVAMRIRVGG